MNNEKERTEAKPEGLEEVRKGKLRTLETKLSASVERRTYSETSKGNEAGSSLIKDWKLARVFNTIIKEFDPGSGRTLAARLTHASRTELRGACFS